MQDPFKPKRDPMVTMANAVVPVLVDRLGGTVTVSEIELAALSERYGGAVGVKARQVELGVYQLSLVPVKPEFDLASPTS